jgi:DsbC/DsbD-like thiol-disulfide interchange protein
MKHSRALSLTLALCAAAPAMAGSYDDTIHHQILSGWKESDGSHIAALDVALAPGWKTYWRAPGEAGIPPYFDWSGSENLKSVGFIWPAPEVFESSGYKTIGYKDGLVLPMRLVPQDPSKPIILRGQVDMGVCEEICMPVTLPFSADLPLQGHRDPKIAAAMASRPFSRSEAGVRDVDCDLEPTSAGLTLNATLAMPPSGTRESSVVEVNNPRIWVDPAETRRAGNTLHISADLSAISGSSMMIDRSAITFTVLGSDYAVEVHGCD